jgi:selenocysteine lyase/cysteine desulfurase
LIPNTTFGVNIVAEGFRWKVGDNVVLLGDDFPSNRLPWYQQRSEGVEIREVPSENGGYKVEKILDHFDAKTKILALSWVGYATGFRMPLNELASEARRRGVYVFLDAIQGLGVFPINVQETPIDFLAADGHKWLLGPEGAGIFYCRKELIDVLRCRMVGWNSVVARHDFTSRDDRLRPAAARWEGGSANLCGHLALRASFRIFEQVTTCHGTQAIAEQVLENSRRLSEALSNVGAEIFSPKQKDERSGIVIFRMPNEAPSETRRRCAQRDVIVNCRGQGVRASIHAYNDDDDIARLMDTLKG